MATGGPFNTGPARRDDMALASWWWVIVAIIAIVALWAFASTYWNTTPVNPAPVTVPAEPALPPVVN